MTFAAAISLRTAALWADVVCAFLALVVAWWLVSSLKRGRFDDGEGPPVTRRRRPRAFWAHVVLLVVLLVLLAVLSVAVWFASPDTGPSFGGPGG